jgi:ABC-type transporter MlaC component
LKQTRLSRISKNRRPLTALEADVTFCRSLAPRSLALALCALTLALAAAPAHAAGKSASAAIEASNKKLRDSLRNFYHSTGAKREAARKEARAAVGSLLDFDTFAKETLGKHWDKLIPAERARYTAAMRGAMEANYLAKMQAGNVDVESVKTEILGEEKRGEHTIVKTKIHSGADTVEVDYAMANTPKGPHAVDLITEGVSLVDTYKDQINTLLPKKGLNGVIDAFERVRKRAEKQQDEQADKQTGVAAPARSPNPGTGPAANPGSDTGPAPAPAAPQGGTAQPQGQPK